MNIERRHQREEMDRGRIEAVLPHPMFKEVWPKALRLPNLKLVDPLQQGDGCFGFNGLYAAVNAIRLATAKRRQFSNREAEDLIEAGFRFLEAHRSLAACAVSGLGFQLWSRLARALCATVERRFGLRLFVEQPLVGLRTATLVQTLDVLDVFVARANVTVILRCGGKYTLVSGYTPESLLLFDSQGFRSIRRASCGVRGDKPAPRYRLCPWSITTFTGL